MLAWHMVESGKENLILLCDFLCFRKKYSFLCCALNAFAVHLQNHAAEMARRINIRNENMLTAQQYQRRASENSE